MHPMKLQERHISKLISEDLVIECTQVQNIGVT
jgi:hypothetical protein